MLLDAALSTRINWCASIQQVSECHVQSARKLIDYGDRWVPRPSL